MSGVGLPAGGVADLVDVRDGRLVLSVDHGVVSLIGRLDRGEQRAINIRTIGGRCGLVDSENPVAVEGAAGAEDRPLSEKSLAVVAIYITRGKDA